MRRGTLLASTLAIVTITVLAIYGAAAGSRLSAANALDEAKGGSAFEPVAPLESTMEVVGDLFDATEEHLKAGKFKNIKREAFVVAELINIALLEKEHKGNKDWETLAMAARDGALKLAQAGGKKDEAGVKAGHKALEAACEACHKKFRD